MGWTVWEHISSWDTTTKVVAALVLGKTLALFIYSVVTAGRENPRGGR